MLHAIRHGLTRVGESTSHPAAFAVVGTYAVAWLIFSPDTFRWAAIATLATWLMTLFINRTEHRDTQAIHAKIDELLRTQGFALHPSVYAALIKQSDPISGVFHVSPNPRIAMKWPRPEPLR
jgi:hypothetical protein